MESETRQQIEAMLSSNPVVLYMKGTRQRPQCGFSARVVEMLEALGSDYVTIDVLSDPNIRQAIKEFSSWPTIPQLYVRGELIGGCDIVTELFEKGELEGRLGVAPREIKAPVVALTEHASAAFAAARESETDCVRLEVDARFNHGLALSEKRPGDFEILSHGVTILVDRQSAPRADGVTIDYVDGPEGKAFKIENPNEPPRVRPMAPADLKRRLKQAEPLTLIDVRTPGEREVANIEGSSLLDQQLFDELQKKEPHELLVFFCHTGGRSQRAAAQFAEQGFRNVFNLTGGIDAWSMEIDPDVQRY